MSTAAVAGCATGLSVLVGTYTGFVARQLASLRRDTLGSLLRVTLSHGPLIEREIIRITGHEEQKVLAALSRLCDDGHVRKSFDTRTGCRRYALKSR